MTGELDRLQLQKRHSVINPQSLVSGFEKLVGTFLSELQALSETQQRLTEPDPLKAKIESLFNGRVGKAPENQAVVDEIYKEADIRFKLKIPPGYQDSDKDKDVPDVHLHGNILYKRKFADYLIWRQILSHAKANSIKYLILITDDGKEDWWHKIESDGPKIIGPRPELIDEARLNGSVETFLMYNPEGFLKYAKEFLQAQISEETLKEVRDVSITSSARAVDYREIQTRARYAERAVFNWLRTRFERVDETRFRFPDFVAYVDGKPFGFDVKLVRNPHMVSILRETIYRSYYEIAEKRFFEITIVLVIVEIEDLQEIKRALTRMFREKMTHNVRVIIGVIDDTGDIESGEFKPLDEFSPGER
jgi:hypothetical protein